jgi:hypothetical protein
MTALDIALGIYFIGASIGVWVALLLLFGGGGDGSVWLLFPVIVLAVIFWPITLLYCWGSFYFGPGGQR